ncbi:MAG: hypothetical protein GY915_07705 [bacterium]|nr:hypothetical protein [bacterium]
MPKGIVSGAAVLLFLSGIGLYLAGLPPFFSKRDLPKWVKQPIAHRGLFDAARGIPENSMTAFRRAKEAGFSIELDVHLSRDGQVVVLHDFDTQGMTGKALKVQAASVVQLQDLFLEGTDQTIPTLKQVLGLVQGIVPIYIETKHSHGGPIEASAPLESAVIELLKGYQGPVVILSFNPYSLAWFKENHPHLLRGQDSSHDVGPEEPAWRRFFLKHFLFNWKSQPDLIGYDVEGVPRWTVELQRWVRPLVVFTVHEISQWATLKKFADNMFFERIDPKGLV